MKKTATIIGALSALLIGSAAMAQNTVAVDQFVCNSEGDYGMQAIHDGSGNTAFVQDDTPADEVIYRASFEFDPNTLSQPHASKFMIAAALQEGAGLRPFQVLMSFNNVNGNKVWCQYAQNNGNIGASAKLDVLPGEFNNVMIEWVQSDPAPAANGVCRVTVTNTGGTNSVEANGFRNAAFAVGRARMGITGRAAIPNNGTMCFDDFQSFRTLAAP